MVIIPLAPLQSWEDGRLPLGSSTVVAGTEGLRSEKGEERGPHKARESGLPWRAISRSIYPYGSVPYKVVVY